MNKFKIGDLIQRNGVDIFVFTVIGFDARHYKYIVKCLKPSRYKEGLYFFKENELEHCTDLRLIIKYAHFTVAD